MAPSPCPNGMTAAGYTRGLRACLVPSAGRLAMTSSMSRAARASSVSARASVASVSPAAHGVLGQ